MPYTQVPYIKPGSVWDAARHNSLIRDNMEYLNSVLGQTARFIETRTLEFEQSSVLISDIPQTASHLILDMRATLRIPGQTGGIPVLQFNGDTGANYSTQYIIVNPSTPIVGVESVSKIGVYLPAFPSIESAQYRTGALFAKIIGYSQTYFFKNIRSLIGFDETSEVGGIRESFGVWRSMAPITSLTFSIAGFPSASFIKGSSFTLIGID